MNNRPWPPYPQVIPVDANSVKDASLNELIRLYNELTQQVGGLQDQIQQLLKDSGEGYVLPYDGVSPDHDDVPYVITNGVLLSWPATYMTIADTDGNVQFQSDTSGKYIYIGGDVDTWTCLFDQNDSIVYPWRLVLQVAVDGGHGG
jgi:hypothetical protein